MSINLDYKKKIWTIYHQPEFVTKPRGLKIAEILNDSWTVDMDNPIITIADRKLSYDFRNESSITWRVNP